MSILDLSSLKSQVGAMLVQIGIAPGKDYSRRDRSERHALMMGRSASMLGRAFKSAALPMRRVKPPKGGAHDYGRWS